MPKASRWIEVKEEVEMFEELRAPKHQRSKFWDRLGGVKLLPINRTAARTTVQNQPDVLPEVEAADLTEPLYDDFDAEMLSALEYMNLVALAKRDEDEEVARRQKRATSRKFPHRR